MKYLIIFAVIVGVLWAGFDGSDEARAVAREEDKQAEQIRKSNKEAMMNACVQRGYAYYDMLGYGKGNYMLSTGVMRNDQVLSMCENTKGNASF